MSVGHTHTCGVTTEGVAYCWGENRGHQLGDGTTISSTTPVRVAGGLIFASVSAGMTLTCGVTTAGALYCWGDGYGMPGFGPAPVAFSEGLAFAAVSLGPFHACGITTTGIAYCWGETGSGKLGHGAMYGSSGLSRVAGGLTFAAVSAGVYTSCGVTITGAAYCWGNNALGGLGTGTSIGPEQCNPSPFQGCSTVPVAVTGGLTFRQVDAKVHAACGVTTSGTAYCWGSNLNDDLGFGTKAGPEQCAWDESYLVPCSRVPAVIPGAPNLVSLADSDSYTCGLTSTGVAYCWGYPQNLGDLNSNTAPVAVPGGLTFATLSAGQYSTCGVTTAGVAYCWGNNEYGQLGDEFHDQRHRAGQGRRSAVGKPSLESRCTERLMPARLARTAASAARWRGREPGGGVPPPESPSSISGCRARARACPPFAPAPALRSHRRCSATRPPRARNSPRWPSR